MDELLLKDEPEILEMMLADEASQDELYKPGPYWRGYRARKVDVIRKRGISAFRNDPIVGKGYADGPRTDPRVRWQKDSPLRYFAKTQIVRLPFVRSIVGTYESMIRDLDQRMKNYRGECYRHTYDAISQEFSFPETMAGGCTDFFVHDGRRISTRYVDFYQRIQRFANAVPFESARTFFEIGGGFGANTHLMLARYPNIRKVVYLDIPPMGYVGTQYLKHYFGDAVKDYAQTRNEPSLGFSDDDSLEILCLCPWQLEQATFQADVFWNSISFPEMPTNVVRNYARLIVRNMMPRTGQLCILAKREAGSEKSTVSSFDDIRDAFAPTYVFDELPGVESAPNQVYIVGKNA